MELLVVLLLAAAIFCLVQVWREQASRVSAAMPAVLELEGDGTYDFDVVGESHYQDALEEICGGRCEEGHELEVQARLVCENGNPHDPNAVAVFIQGRKVAHLSREDARGFRRSLERKGLAGRAVQVPALIVGGWQRERRNGGPDLGSFGVKLDL